ncbi:hypothetical protein POKO110462_09830 [Pontibacter korlensis]|uniref:PepSY domain-containing protein n=1 Tax=Pontibacter korlensis TaxID=400092 RepID=A0A0E3ZFU1_9BACT|nr:hypothetical protein [Pontibacter korlensis]AKD03080.1 hypothetical protein PKOR_08040 [Pontibacter korlensis]
MKKATFFAAAIAILGFTSLDANAQMQGQGQQGQTQTQGQQGQQTGQTQEGNREQVTQDQLPEAIQNALKSDVYKEWTVGEIYKVTPTEGAANSEVVYEVRMTNASGQAGVVRLNEKGGAADSSDQE